MKKYYNCIPPGSFRNLADRHYHATGKRGMIRPQTSLHDFMDKIEEEFYETRNACTNFGLSGEMIQESVDLCATVINMLKFYNYDFIEEYRKNVEYQESRVV